MSLHDSTNPSLPVDALLRIDQICSDFEHAWSDGQTPVLESYLQQVGSAERTLLLGHLLNVELEFRRNRGEVYSEKEYLARFSDDTNIVASVFRKEAERLCPTKKIDGVVARSSDYNTFVPSPSITKLIPFYGEQPALAGYEVLSEIARGGMGAVYRVRERKFERSLALKVMLPGVASDPEMAERFRKEARITGQLQHPGIPPVHDQADLENGLPFFTMKLIEGQTLKDLLKKRSMSLNTTKDVRGSREEQPRSELELPHCTTPRNTWPIHPPWKSSCRGRCS